MLIDLAGFAYFHGFDDLSYLAGDVEKLKKAYDHVDDIDLFVGGFMEKRDIEDAILGPVFRCIVNDTFTNLKFGDR